MPVAECKSHDTSAINFSDHRRPSVPRFPSTSSARIGKEPRVPKPFIGVRQRELLRLRPSEDDFVNGGQHVSRWLDNPVLSFVGAIDL